MKKQLIIKKTKPEKQTHLLKIRSVVVLSVFVLPILFILMLVYTYLGLKLSVFALNKFIPEIKIEQVQGSLNDLHLTGFDLDLDGVKVTIGDASISISGLCLLQGKICIKNFDANQVMVKVYDGENQDNNDSTQESDENLDPNERWLLKMPLPIDLEKMHLTKVDVYVDDMEFGMSDFTGKAIWVNEKLYVYPAVAQDLRAIFADTPQDSKQPARHQKDNQNKEENPETLYASLTEFFNQPLIDYLDLVNIPLDVNVTSLKGENWFLHIGGEDVKFKRASIQTEMINNHIMLKRLETDVVSSFASGQVSATGSIIMADDWPLTINMKVKTDKDEAVGLFTGKLLGEFSSKGKVVGLNQMDFETKVNFVEKHLPIIAEISGKHFRWPMTDKPVYEFDDFRFSLAGKPQHYQLTTHGALSGPNLPNASFDIAGNGTHEKLVLDHAKVQFPQGDISISGHLSWLKSMQWDLLTKVESLDLVNDLPNYPIKLQGLIEVSGKSDNAAWQVNLKKIDLDGSINNTALFAAGALEMNSQQLVNANNFKLTWGRNSVSAEGSNLAKGLVSQINLTTLSLIDDDFSGAVNGDVEWRGTLEKPNIKANLNVANFLWQDVFAKEATIAGNVQYQNQLSGKVTLKGKNIEWLNDSISDAIIELSGNEEEHQLTIDINGKPASFGTKLTGRIDKKTSIWQTTVPQIRFYFGQDNEWVLDHPLKLAYNINKQRPTIGEHCWLNGDAKICLTAPFSLENKQQTTLVIENVDLAKLPIPNSGETKLAGNIGGKASIKWSEGDKLPDVSMSIDSKNVYIQQLISSQVLPVPFDLFFIDAQFNHKQAKLNWNFSLKELGKLSGSLLIVDPTNKKQLSGDLSIKNLSLSILNPLLEGNDYAIGTINGDLKFADNLLDPSITGRLDLHSSEIQSNQLPADVTSAIFGIDFEGKSSKFKGFLKSHAGDININGHADWNKLDDWNAELSIVGAAMEISAPPMLKLSIIPNVNMKARRDELTLSGTVDIPKGRVIIESMPASSVDVSSDEVLLDKNKQEIQQEKSSITVHSNLELVLGEDVTINAFGLDANLKGKLSIFQNAQGFGVNGQIGIPTGRFRAYGQDLLIRKGEVIFSGPIAQPLLNIEAIRNPEVIEDNMTAGIRVTGLASDPQIEIFSEPSLTKQETLSYLLNGQSLSSASTGNNDLMTILLVSLGTSQGGKYIGNVGDLLGIKNLTLDTQGSGESYKVVVSGYLLPNLQLKYGMGIFDSLATFTFRYRLMPKLYLEAISGVDSTLNFLYQFEF